MRDALAKEAAHARLVIVELAMPDESLPRRRKRCSEFTELMQVSASSVEMPIELYDFFFESYGRSSKEMLLNLMSNRPDIDRYAC